MAVFVASPFGASVRGTRDQPRRMNALGYHVWMIRFLAFLVSGFWTGVAGVLYLYYNQFVSPQAVALAASAEALLMVIAGGTATLLGPITGAALVVVMKNVASAYIERWNFVLGAIFVAIVVFMPEGLVPGTVRLARWTAPRGARAGPGERAWLDSRETWRANSRRFSEGHPSSQQPLADRAGTGSGGGARCARAVARAPAGRRAVQRAARAGGASSCSSSPTLPLGGTPEPAGQAGRHARPPGELRQVRRAFHDDVVLGPPGTPWTTPSSPSRSSMLEPGEYAVQKPPRHVPRPPPLPHDGDRGAGALRGVADAGGRRGAANTHVIPKMIQRVLVVHSSGPRPSTSVHVKFCEL